MSFEIVKVRPFGVGGLVVPGVEPGSGSDLTEFTLERLRARGLRDLTVVYTRHPDAGWSALFGYRCDGVPDLTVGDSFIAVAEKYAARFVPDGPSPDHCQRLWQQVEAAEKEGLIERSFREEVLVLPEKGAPELYISLA